MNIAIVIPTIKAGGAEKQAVLLAKCLSVSHKVFFYIFFGDLPKENKHVAMLDAARVKYFSLTGSTIKKTRVLTLSLI